MRRQHAWNGLPVPYVAAWDAEHEATPRPILRNVRGVLRIGYESETPYDRDDMGSLWARQALAQGRGTPHFADVHLLRQRRAMLDMLCQVCGAATGQTTPHLWLLATRPGGVTGPIREGEVTTSPPVCAPCAATALRHCPHLRRGAVAGHVRHAPRWGIAGIAYDRRSLEPVPGPDLALVPDDHPHLRWTLAYRVAVELLDVTPLPLEAVLAAGTTATRAAAGASEG